MGKGERERGGELIYCIRGAGTVSWCRLVVMGDIPGEGIRPRHYASHTRTDSYRI